MRYKVFEGDTMQEAMDKLLKEGYRPANSETVWRLREEKKIPDKWYDTGTVVMKGKVRKATLRELKDMKSFYESGGRVLFLDIDCNDLNGNVLDNDGRFVGEKK